MPVNIPPVKVNYYAVVAAIVFGAFSIAYTQFMLPTQEAKEDANNIAVLNDIKHQLENYIYSEAKKVDKKGIDNSGAFFNSLTDSIDKRKYIDYISISEISLTDSVPAALNITRTINIKGGDKSQIDTKTETIKLPIADFKKSISQLNNFVSLRIVQINQKPDNKSGKQTATTTSISDNLSIPGKDGVLHRTLSINEKGEEDKGSNISGNTVLLSENVSLQDQDSLSLNAKSSGPFSFKKSAIRYYNDQLHIPGTEFTMLISAGVKQDDFTATVRGIRSPILLLGMLSCVVLLMLSISFIKPIISSHKERLSQRDLVSVIFCIGALIALVAVFGMVVIWERTIRSGSSEDLKQLTDNINGSLTQQAEVSYKGSLSAKEDEYKTFDSEKLNFKDTINKYEIKIKGSAYSRIYSKLKPTHNSIIKNIHEYFVMDKNGLMQGVVANNITMRRSYRDRDYIEKLQSNKINTIFLPVFSREKNRYQWIYAKKETKPDKNLIRGVSFNAMFSNIIKIPKGTSYVIVDNSGNVLMQSSTQTRLHQNLIVGNEDDQKFIALLSGNHQGDFTIEYQGIPYQAYGIPLALKTDIPLFVIALRDLSFINRLSVFTFVNSFLLSLIYGLFICVLMLIFSAVLYNGRSKVFSKHHFYYLFPNNSRSKEYKFLLWANIASMIAVACIALFCIPSTVIYSCIIFGSSIALYNLLVLNAGITPANSKNIYDIGKLLAVVCILCFIIELLYPTVMVILVLIPIHIGIIIKSRRYLPRHTTGDTAKAFDQEHYSKFITVMLINHFGIFPIILCSAIYITELNDFIRWNCADKEYATALKKTKNTDNPKKVKDSATVMVYNCDCDPIPDDQGPDFDLPIRMVDSHLLDRPAEPEMKNFSMGNVINGYFIQSFEPSVSLKQWPLHLGFFATMVLLTFFIIYLVKYYGNRFFFYDLMEAYRKNYYQYKHPNRKFKTLIAYPDKKTLPLFIEDELVEIQQQNKNGKMNIQVLINKTLNNKNILLWEDFIIRSNIEELEKTYQEIWETIPKDEQYILFDFSRDGFVNYKNKDVIMYFMEKGIINCDSITGRLKLMNPNFGKYLLYKKVRDKNFITGFAEESQGGYFSKLKLPIIIIAVCSFVLLMYLNNGSYDKVALLGTGMATAMSLVDRLLGFYKSA